MEFEAKPQCLSASSVFLRGRSVATGELFTSEKSSPLKVSLKPFQILAGIDSVHDLPPSPLSPYRHWKNEVFPLKFCLAFEKASGEVGQSPTVLLFLLQACF